MGKIAWSQGSQNDLSGIRLPLLTLFKEVWLKGSKECEDESTKNRIDG
jgi:hypothetical protein